MEGNQIVENNDAKVTKITIWTVDFSNSNHFRQRMYTAHSTATQTAIFKPQILAEIPSTAITNAPRRTAGADINGIQ
jgi:hypothetical protein